MKKTFNFIETDKEYILESTNPNVKKEPFKIEKESMEFNNIIGIEIVNKTEDCGDKYARLTYQTIKEICEGVSEKLNAKLIEK